MSQRMEVFTVTDPAKEGDKAFWTRIGMAFHHERGEGWNLNLNALPVNGRIVMMPPKPKEEQAEEKTAPVQPTKPQKTYSKRS